MEYWEKYLEFDESSICYKVMGDQTGWLWVVKNQEMESDKWDLTYKVPMEEHLVLFNLASIYFYVTNYFILDMV